MTLDFEHLTCATQGNARRFRISSRVRTIVAMRATTLVRSGMIAVGLLALVGCRPVLVNVPESGHGQVGTGVFEPPAISDSGRAIAFVTSDYLTADDHDGTWDVYVRDTRRRHTALMSVSPNGDQDYCGSNSPQVSGDGRYVAYSGCAEPPVVPPPPGTVATKIYVKDRTTGALEHVGIREEAGIQGGGFQLLDYDASHVVFWCFPSPEFTVSVCVQDRHTGNTTLVSVATDGQTVDGFPVPASISDDGRLVAFTAPFAAVVPGSTDTRRQLFVRDVAAGATSAVVIDATVLPGDLDGRLSGDGTAAVVWQTAPPYHVVHKDLITGAVQRVDQAASDVVTSPTTYGFARISDDGDVVAFQSSSDTLVPHDMNHHDDVFVWRIQVPSILQRVSVGPGLREGDGDSYWPALSGDGTSVAFVSEATNLVRDDTNGAPDVFVVKLGPRLP
jgi:Tol biopolymer transport system component